MIRQLSVLAAHPHLVLLGWSIALVLWQTTAVALVLALWRFTRPGASARAQYAASLCAFGGCVLLAFVTPVTLSHAARQSSTLSSDVTSGMGAATTRAVAAAVELVAGEATASPPMDLSPFIGWLSVVWLCGVAVLGIRLIGGWILAERMRRSARAISSRNLQALTTRALSEARVSRPVAVLESDDVDAPVAVGWTRPAVILPRDLADQLPPESWGPLLAHEVAHIVRSDYAVNVVQSVADVLLFFSPGAWWISRTVREAREYCCDDLAACDSADTRTYVRALTAMAALGSAHRRRPALGAAGPRLIVRVRRLLQEDNISRVSRVQIFVLASVLGLVSVTTVGVTAASLGGVSQAAIRRLARATASAATDTRIPISFPLQQTGSGIRILSMTSSVSRLCDSAVLQNSMGIPLVEVGFAGVVTSRASREGGVAVFESDPVSVDVPAGAATVVSIGFLSPEEARNVKGGSIEVMCALRHVRFADGSEWIAPPMSQPSLRIMR